MKSLLILSVLFFLSVISVFSQLEGNPANWCRNGFFPRDSEKYSIGYIKALKGERVYFYDDQRECPNDKNCRRKSYLVKKDEVLISRTFGNYVCAWYQPKPGSEIVGWLPKVKLEFTSILSEKVKPWLGEWKFYDNSLNISRGEKPGNFKVTGNAFWKGFGDNIHIGEVDSSGTLEEENVLKLKDGDCEIKLNLVVHYLVVSDNLQCGGMNVTFSGVYLKKSAG